MTKTVYISPSLQTWNIGVGDYGAEASRMRHIGNIIVQKLLAYPSLVVYTSNEGMKLSQAIADSNRKRVDLHVAVHSNAAGGSGALVLYQAGNMDGLKAARKISAKLEAVTPYRDQGVRPSSSLIELKDVRTTSVIVEVSFHDNPIDADFIENHSEDIAQAVVDGILEYLGVEKLDKTVLNFICNGKPFTPKDPIVIEAGVTHLSYTDVFDMLFGNREVALRDVAAMFGLKLEWDEDTRTITITGGSTNA